MNIPYDDESADAAVAVSVIMPAYNARHTIEAQLAALAVQDYPGSWELIVSDNGCTDDTAAIAHKWKPDFPVPLHILDSSQARGVSHARNVGVEHATGGSILICDADDIVSQGWIRHMVDALEGADIVGGRCVLDYRAFASGVPADNDLCFPTFAYHGFLPFASGANFGMRAGVHEAIGGWSKDFVGGSDDVEYSWRAQLAGFSLGFSSDAHIYYRARSTLVGLARQKYRYGFTAVALYVAYRRHGVRRRSLWIGLKSWLWLIVNLPMLRTDERRRLWVSAAAGCAGRLAGIVRYRVVYL